MGIWNVWLETRGTVIRREFEDAIAKTPGDRTPARFAFLNHVTQTHGAMLKLYSAASPSERRAIMRCAKRAAISMWRQGAWPSAVGFEIICFNVESRFVPGVDAAFVKAQTDKIIKEALRAHSSAHPIDRPPVGAWIDGGTSPLSSRCRNVPSRPAEFVFASLPSQHAGSSKLLCELISPAILALSRVE